MFNNMLMGAAGESIKATSFSVDNSAMFNEPDDEYFTRTPSSASNQRTWTFSTWVKRGKLGSDQRIFTAASNGGELFFDANDKLNAYQYEGGYTWNYISTQVFRDPHAWYHIVQRVDTTQGSFGDRVRLYVNGEQITAFDTSTAPSQNATGYVNSAVAHYIGRYSGSNSMHYDGYLAETILIDGQSLAPASFGETDDNGVWRPIDVSSSGLFDASNSVVPTATTWTLGSTMSAGTGTLDKSGAGGTSALYVRMLEGDFKVTFTAAALNDALFGVFDYTEIGTFNASQDDGFLDSMTNSFWYDEGQTDVNYGNTTVAASKTIAAGSVVTIERSGSTIKITDDGSDVHEFTQTFSGPVGFIAGHRNTGANSLDFNSISFDGVSGIGKNGFYLPFTTSTFLGADYTESGTQTTFNAASDWTGSTGSYTFTKGSIEADTGDKAVKSDQTFAGDFEFQWRYVAKANWVIGVYDTAEDGTFNDSNSGGGMASMTDSFYVQASSVAANNDIFYGNSVVVNATTISDGDTWKIGRVGSQIKVYRNGSVVHTYSQTNSDTMRIVFAQGDTAADADSISWVDGTGSVGNNFFAVNSPTQSSDSPTNNAAILSPLWTDTTLSNGNLKAVATGNAYQWAISSIAIPSSGKWTCEFQSSNINGSSLYGYIGIAQMGNHNNKTGTSNRWGMNLGNGEVYNGSGTEIHDFSTSSYATTLMRLEYDADADTIKIFSAGSEIFPASTGASATVGLTGQSSLHFFCAPYGSGADFTATFKGLSGTPTSGYLELNTTNLLTNSTPTVGNISDGYVAVTDTEANIVSTLDAAHSYSSYMELYARRDAGEAKILKFSDDASNHLEFSSSAAKASFPTLSGSSSWVGYAFNMSSTYGMFTDQVSHSNGSDTDTAHGLGASVGMVFVKREDATGQWFMLTSGNSSGYNQIWEYPGSPVAGNSGQQNSTVYAGYDSTNVSVLSAAPTGTYRVIAFANIPGFLDLNTYYGNGNANGTFVYTGHSSDFVCVFGVGTSQSAYEKLTVDSTREPGNPKDLELGLANPSTGEDADKSAILGDTLSNGFKHRDANAPNSTTNPYFIWSYGSPFAGTTPNTAQ